MNWTRSSDRLSATGPHSGIRAEMHGGAWWIVDRRAAGRKPHAFGPYQTDGAAREAAEARYDNAKRKG